MSAGRRLFQRNRLIQESARCTLVDIRQRGTGRSPWAAKQSNQQPDLAETGTNSSRMYDGAEPTPNNSTRATRQCIVGCHTSIAVGNERVGICLGRTCFSNT